jgi:hypothetical protein
MHARMVADLDDVRVGDLGERHDAQAFAHLLQLRLDVLPHQLGTRYVVRVHYLFSVSCNIIFRFSTRNENRPESFSD